MLISLKGIHDRKRKCCFLLLILVGLVFVLAMFYWNNSDYDIDPATPARLLPEQEPQQKVILLWTIFFGVKDFIKPMDQIGCPELNCHVTSDKRRIKEADAIVFHVSDMNLNDLPKYRNPEQRWIYLNHEPPGKIKDFKHHLDGLMNWTATYRLDSEIQLSPLVTKKSPESKRGEPPVVSSKKKMATWFVSNCRSSSNREAYIRELQKTIQVDVVGKCGTIRCSRSSEDTCYRNAARDYFFYLSFENSICKDYVTEKLFNLLNYDLVPVVLGGSDYTRMAPPGSYINALDFDSPRALGEYLLELSRDPVRYRKFFEWRTTHEMTDYHYACQICRKLHDPEEPTTVWNQLHKWWYDDAHCARWNEQKQQFESSYT